MNLAEAVKLLNGDRLDYLESFNDPNIVLDRAGSLSQWIDFRTNYGCPDIDEEEEQALEVVARFVAKTQQQAIDSLVL